jgi:hypothetical protein
MMQQDNNGNAVLTAKIYCTFVCFVVLFQSILMYGGQRLKLKDTSAERDKLHLQIHSMHIFKFSAIG